MEDVSTRRTTAPSVTLLAEQVMHPVEAVVPSAGPLLMQPLRSAAHTFPLAAMLMTAALPKVSNTSSGMIRRIDFIIIS